MKKKMIEDNELISLIDEYVMEECKGRTNRLQTRYIVSYVQQNGYPNFKDFTLQRSEPAMEHLKELRATSPEEQLAKVASFRTLDIEKYKDKKYDKEKLISEMVALNNYYKKICDSAVVIFKQDKELQDEIAEKDKQLKENEALIKKLYQDISSRDNKNAELKKDLKTYKDIVEENVYPEIANKLLKERGMNVGTTEHIIEEPDIIRGDNLISFSDSLLKVFDGGKDEN